LALLIAALAAGQFDLHQISEVELDNGFEHLGDRAAMQTVGQSREPIGIYPDSTEIRINLLPSGLDAILLPA
jgi:hypothetical protein